MKTTAMKRFTSGLLAGGVGIVFFLIANLRGWVVGGLVDGVSVALSLLGLFFIFVGLMLVMDGHTIARRGEASPHRRDETPPHTHTPHPPHPTHSHDRPPAFPEEADDEMAVEEPTKKECPACHKYVFKDARVCRFCGHSFPITYILKIHRHEDLEKNEHLIKLLAMKLHRSEQGISELLDSGLRLSYSTQERMETNRKKFEHFGCPVEAYEKVGRG
ncbi:MAG: hypothetical protein JW885_03700 [Deltaproteobacteria bacterium]|nr:hypothetical protein [Candidatus Zymogenaceae bacterium]